MQSLKIFLLYLFLGMSSAVSAQEIDISGTFSYDVTANSVEISVERITNNTNNRTTGTLYVTLRMTQSSSPFSNGYTVAQESLSYIGNTGGQLTPGQSFSNIRFSTPYTTPPQGNYYVHIVISEYPTLTTSLDTVTFSNIATIAGNDNGGGNGNNNSNNLVNIDGFYTYQVDGNIASIRIDRIQNTSTNTTTGTLYISLRMTEGSSPHSSGYTVAQQSLTSIGSGTGQLAPGAAFTNINFSAEYSAPPPGTYYVHLTVSQFPSLDTLIETATFDDRLTITSTNPDTGNNGGGNGLGLATISGTYAYDTQGDSVTIEVERITNNSQTVTTGTLYLSLRMTESSSPFSSGYTVAREALTFGSDSTGQLSPGEYYQNIRFTSNFTQPPSGDYYVHLIVSQYPDLDTAIDTASFTNRASFSNISNNPAIIPVLSNNAADPLAGSMGAFMFVLLLVSVFLRIRKQ